MTVANANNRNDYDGNGVTVAFAITFRFLENSHILATLTDSLDGVEVTQVLDVDYTLADAGEATGGTLTMTTAPSSTQHLTILRNVPFTQTTDYVENTSFPAESHETALDKLTMEIQQMEEEIDRCIKTSISEGATGVTADTIEAYIDEKVAEEVDATFETNTFQVASAAVGATSVTVTGFVLAAVTEDISVYIDGVKQADDSITRDSDYTISLGGALVGGELIEVVSRVTDPDAATGAAASAASAAASAAAATAAAAAYNIVTDLATDVAAAGSANTTLVIVDQQAVADDLVCGSNIYLDIRDEGRIIPATGKTVTIYSAANVIAPLAKQIFGGAGTVASTVKTSGNASVDWWGTGTTAFDAALDFCEMVVALGANYTLTSVWEIDQPCFVTLGNTTIQGACPLIKVTSDGVKITGVSAEDTLLNYTGSTSTHIPFEIASGANPVKSFSLEGVAVQGGARVVNNIIKIDGMRLSQITDVKVGDENYAVNSLGAKYDNIAVYKSWNNVWTNVRSSGAGRDGLYGYFSDLITNSAFNNNTFVQCTFTENLSWGVNVQRGYSNMFLHCFFADLRSVGQGGIFCNGAQHTIMIGCVFEALSTSGYNIFVGDEASGTYKSYNNRFTDCRSEGGPTVEVHFEHGGNNIIEGYSSLGTGTIIEIAASSGADQVLHCVAGSATTFLSDSGVGTFLVGGVAPQVMNGIYMENSSPIRGYKNDGTTLKSMLQITSSDIMSISEAGGPNVYVQGNPTADGETGLFLYLHDGTLTWKRVLMGADDSGGGGYRLLRVAN